MTIVKNSANNNVGEEMFELAPEVSEIIRCNHHRGQN